MFEFKRILKPGGSVIIFYDIWKSQNLKYFAEKNGFKQARVCQWGRKVESACEGRGHF
jgi:site-specific DNA-methyltransferase (adenine-specific)